MSRATLSLPLALIAMGCAAATSGASPHDTSAASHERAAAAHQRTSSEHAARYDRTARENVERCAGSRQRAAHIRNTDTCWTSVRNPTAAHAREAAEHKRHAADHRAASASLRETEARACAGISEGDRATSPFQHPEDIESVEPFTKPGNQPNLPGEQIKGAVVMFRAVPGMTAKRLQQLVDCHLARNSALGHVVPEMPDCPLVPKGVTATVSASGNGFRVTIRASDPEGAVEVLARTKRLVPP
ncbi:MAG: hypothetical protein HYZ29_06315 [Myxococcales bacterium]|nr:hypothetical protein [Myxococcales bacterium]